MLCWKGDGAVLTVLLDKLKEDWWHTPWEGVSWAANTLLCNNRYETENLWRGCTALPHLVTEMKELTECYFRTSGVESVFLFRGMNFYRSDVEEYTDQDGPVVEFASRLREKHIIEPIQYKPILPLESWSTSLKTAVDFARINYKAVGVIVATNIPVSDLVSTWFTGIGDDQETEVIVSGGPREVLACAFETKYGGLDFPYKEFQEAFKGEHLGLPCSLCRNLSSTLDKHGRCDACVDKDPINFAEMLTIVECNCQGCTGLRQATTSRS